MTGGIKVKKLFKIMFHRAVLTGMALLVQATLLVAVILKFKQYFVFFYGVSIVLSIVAVVLIINSDMSSGYKIAWMIPIMLFPIFGGLFYIFFGGKKLSRRVKRKMNSVEQKMKESLSERPSIIEELEREDVSASNHSKYIQDYAYSPPYKNTYTEYLPSGEAKFKALKEELKKAKRFIFMEYFIIEEGKMWNEILQILKDKVKEGVDVRVMYDDVGCLMTLPMGYSDELEKLGIKCAVFNPFAPVLSSRLNNRDHRKITVVDGHTGFTGGINLADEYINEYVKYGHWKDTAILLKGDAVWSLTVMFLSLWDYVNDIDEDYSLYRPLDSELELGRETGDGYVQPFTDNPLDEEPVGESVYLNLINRARKYIYINTPYLIIDTEMVVALSVAAKSGVDVKIVTPHIADKRIVHSMTRSYYPVLIRSGVKIYEYTPGFMHAKSFVVDDEYGVVGTINMDYRSLYLHYECGVWLYKTGSIADIKADFLETLKLCREFTKKDVESIPIYKILARSVIRVLAPLM